MKKLAENKMKRGEPWPMKFRPFEVVILRKSNAEETAVRIEGVRHWHKQEEPLYDVRELDSQLGYPVLESKLRRRS